MSFPFSAMLLAGGASKRMGFPKALISCGRYPLWLVQVKKLGLLQPAELFISAPPEIDFITTDQWSVVYDEKPGLGPLAGIDAARRRMTTPWLLVLAVDLPIMSQPFLKGLVNRTEISKSGQVPELDHRFLGLAAIYPRAFLDRHLTAHLESDDRSIQRLVRTGISEGALASFTVREEERHLFRNVNTPDDLELARLLFDRQAPSIDRPQSPV